MDAPKLSPVLTEAYLGETNRTLADMLRQQYPARNDGGAVTLYYEVHSIPEMNDSFVQCYFMTDFTNSCDRASIETPGSGTQPSPSLVPLFFWLYLEGARHHTKRKTARSWFRFQSTEVRQKIRFWI